MSLNYSDDPEWEIIYTLENSGAVHRFVNSIYPGTFIRETDKFGSLERMEVIQLSESDAVVLSLMGIVKNIKRNE